MSETAAFSTPQLQLFDLAGRWVLVLGLGDSGMAMARWALRRGARLRVADTRSSDGSDLPQLQALRAAVAEAAGVAVGGVGSNAAGGAHSSAAGGAADEIEFAGAPAFDDAWLDGVDLIAWSPGLSIEQGESAAFHKRALARGIAVAGELELFAQALAELREGGYQPKVIAVTGTNGKTTTTALAAHLCRAANLKATAAGNIRPALLDALREALEADALPEVWVVELSSFQLALAQSFAPDAAAILNVSEDHLDWHTSMVSYVEAKQRIYAAGTIAVYNRAEPATQPKRAVVPVVTASSRRAAAAAKAAATRAAAANVSMATAGDADAAPAAAPVAPAVAAAGVATSSEERPRDIGVLQPMHVGFGLDAPTVAGDFGLLRDGPLVWLAHAVPLEEESTSARRRKEPPPFTVKRLMPAEALRIRGAHNHLNALAALALCTAIGVPMARLLHGLRGYAGEPHRCQLVAVIDDVEYYDDSKGTNVGATLAALRGLGKRCRLIAGGDGKGQDFAPLAPAVAGHAAAVYLIGRDAPRLRAALADTGVPLVDCASLEEAVQRAAADAVLGDAVLLSPACASLDMFRNYEHRAQVFVAAVRDIAEQRGISIDAGAAC